MDPLPRQEIIDQLREAVEFQVMRTEEALRARDECRVILRELVTAWVNGSPELEADMERLRSMIDAV
jgi:hypothetical protein